MAATPPNEEGTIRTLIFIAVGLVSAMVVLGTAPAEYRLWATAAFTLAWLGVSAWNLRVGLSHGYTLAQELPIHAVLFGVPVLAAWVMWFWWRY